MVVYENYSSSSLRIFCPKHDWKILIDIHYKNYLRISQNWVLFCKVQCFLQYYIINTILLLATDPYPENEDN